MKKELKYLILLPLLTLVGCSNEEDVVSGIVSPQTGETLQLTVTAADFVTDGAPDTRATDDGNKTTFEDGDRVGIIILDESSRPIYDNIPYKYDSSNKKWVFDDVDGKGGCYYDPKAKTYIVYYPYSRAVDGVTSVDVLKTKFAPKFNQSDIKDYRSSDLMVWNSNTHLTSSEKELNAELEHAFASIYLTPTVNGVILDDGIPYTGSYVSEVTDISNISDVSLTIDKAVYVPFQAPDGSLRCIVPAGITPSDIRCFYTIGSKTYGNTISISSDAVAANTRYACQPEIENITYSLSNAHVGDFYCKNSNDEGYLIPGDVALTSEHQAACIGIVFWVGDATQRDQTLKSDYKDCTHGLVVALNDVAAGTTAWQSSYSSVQGWLNNKSGVYLSVASGTGSSEPLNNIQGYNNTKAIEEFNAANGGNLVQAVVKVVEYRDAVPTPNNSSKWYLPSEKELTLLCGRDVDDIWTNNSGQDSDGTANKDLINGKLKSISSIATEISSALYWSSTEYSSYSRYAWRVDFGSGRRVYYNFKSDTYRERCVLAF